MSSCPNQEWEWRVEKFGDHSNEESAKIEAVECECEYPQFDIILCSVRILNSLCIAQFVSADVIGTMRKQGKPS
jgi:hypothetical protein